MVPIIDNEKHRTVKGYLWPVRSMVNGLVFYFLNHVHEYDSDYSKEPANLLPHSLKEQGLI
ncbi:hypothetical protein [Phocaeicola massiliensis]|uniref:hypothetical protein n=1 Tax=Phocaeicola massiliensis TaxID=204516 RepID=UPI0022E980C7|nr:hypothetical protein [Phocaeicola massiliensis]MBS1343306.1 hypothetical protein [Bacteroides sp.]